MDANISCPPSGLPIRFQDADFEHRFAWCWSPLEGRSRRWIPFGMPRLNPNFANTVFFLYGRGEGTAKVAGPLGSGVIIGLPGTGPLAYDRHFYAVSCQHVACTGGASIIRINTKDGKSRLLEFEPDEWQIIRGGSDLAAIDITDKLSSGTDRFSIIQERLFADRTFLKKEEFGIGEDGFMLGLFADLHGKQRNLVAARFGNVSLLADESEPVMQPNGNRRPAHLFDIRSRPGFSGSPVFAYRTPAGDLRTATERGEYEAIRRRSHEATARRAAQENQPFVPPPLVSDFVIRSNTFLVLLGIHAGQYHDDVKVQKSLSPRGESDYQITEGDELSIPNSMCVVVPAWEITALLNLDVFEKQRDARDVEYRKRLERHAMPEAQKGSDHG